MSEFKRQWNLEMALAVFRSETIDSENWTAAAKWLLLYGPPAMQEKLRQAADFATGQCFPGLKAVDYTADGQTCYDVRALAAALGVSEEELVGKIAEMEEKQGVRHLFDSSETQKKQ